MTVVRHGFSGSTRFFFCSFMGLFGTMPCTCRRECQLGVIQNSTKNTKKKEKWSSKLVKQREDDSEIRTCALHVQAWTSSHVKKPSDTMCMEEWWTQEVQLPTKEERRTWAAINMYTVWNLWKERNRRIFEGKEADPVIVFQFMREEMGLRAQACGTPVNFIS